LKIDELVFPLPFPFFGLEPLLHNTQIQQLIKLLEI